MESLLKWLEDRPIRKLEKLMKEYKPQLLNKWYEVQDEQIRKEYEEEMDKLNDQVYQLGKELREMRNSRDYYKGKCEGVLETQEKLINKIEQTGTAKGQLKQEVKQLKEEVAIKEEELKEVTESQET